MRFIAVLLVLFAVSAAPSYAEPAKIDTDTMVKYTTGINPQDYPCAKGAIASLYAKRAEINDLSSYHPQRIFLWLQDMFSYYAAQIGAFIESLFTRSSLESGIGDVTNMVQGRGGNPLAGMDRRIDGWIEDLGPRSQQVLANNVRSIIASTTGPNGLCKE